MATGRSFATATRCRHLHTGADGYGRHCLHTQQAQVCAVSGASRLRCVADRTHRRTCPRRVRARLCRNGSAVFLLLMHGNDILLEKRPGSGIWGGLWCPPQFDDEAAAREWFVRSGMEASEGERLETFTHTFTHFKLYITPLKIQLAHKPLRAEQAGSVWLDVEEALGAAIPTPVRAMLAYQLGRSS